MRLEDRRRQKGREHCAGVVNKGLGWVMRGVKSLLSRSRPDDTFLFSHLRVQGNVPLSELIYLALAFTLGESRRWRFGTLLLCPLLSLLLLDRY